MKLALFDFDGTILEGNSLHLWTRSRFLSPRDGPFVLLSTFLRIFHLRDHRTWKESTLRALIGRSHAEVDAAGEAVYRRRIRPRLRGTALKEIDRCRNQDCNLVLATGAFDFLVQPFCREFDFHACLAAEIEFQNDRCTGRLATGENRGVEKSSRVREHTAGMKVDWENSRAYSDDIEDASLLALVGGPHFIVGRRTRFDQPASHRWTVLKW